MTDSYKNPAIVLRNSDPTIADELREITLNSSVNSNTLSVGKTVSQFLGRARDLAKKGKSCYSFWSGTDKNDDIIGISPLWFSRKLTKEIVAQMRSHGFKCYYNPLGWITVKW